MRMGPSAHAAAPTGSTFTSHAVGRGSVGRGVRRRAVLAHAGAPTQGPRSRRPSRRSLPSAAGAARDPGHHAGPAAILRSRGALPGLGVISGWSARTRPTAGGRPAPFADVGTPRQLRLLRRDVRRDLGALNRLSRGDGASPAEAAATLAEVYSAAILAALGPAGRRAFAERVAGRTSGSAHQGARVRRRLRVEPRALAQVVYRHLRARAVGPLHRPLAADLDGHARPRGRPLAFRPRDRTRSPTQ